MFSCSLNLAVLHTLRISLDASLVKYYNDVLLIWIYEVRCRWLVVSFKGHVKKCVWVMPLACLSPVCRCMMMSVMSRQVHISFYVI